MEEEEEERGLAGKEQRDSRGRHYTMLYLRGDGGSMMGERVWRRRRGGGLAGTIREDTKRCYIYVGTAVQ